MFFSLSHSIVIFMVFRFAYFFSFVFVKFLFILLTFRLFREIKEKFHWNFLIHEGYLCAIPKIFKFSSYSRREIWRKNFKIEIIRGKFPRRATNISFIIKNRIEGCGRGNSKAIIKISRTWKRVINER